MNIIEKLGYVPTSLEPIHYDGKHILVDFGELKEIVRQRDEMLESIITWIASGEGIREFKDIVQTEIDFKTIIQKATGKTWEEIKELL